MVPCVWTTTFFFLIWLCNDVVSKRNHTLKPRVVLPENYVKEMRPPARKGQPVLVEFSIYVVDVNSINVEDMDFRVDMFIRQTWSESRLQLPEDIFEEGDDHVTLPPEFFDNLWHPDPYFLNSKVTVTSIPLIADSKPPLRIIGGRDALHTYELTFVVRMEIQLITKSDAKEVAKNGHICTGTVITPIRTLTAAHCIEGLEAYLKAVRAKSAEQEVDTASKKLNGVIRYGSVHDMPWTKNTVSRIIDSVVHPGYKTYPLEELVINDVGISRTEPIMLATYGRVSTMDFASLTGHEATVVGYGLTNASDGVLHDTLELRKPLQILKAMLKRCPKDSGVYPSTCVARACGQPSSICAGDSGGPVLHTSGILAINTMGVVGDCFVKSDDDRLSVGIFTALSPFIDWIQDQI